MALQTDYAERVYAGVLGKIIGVYVGRPFEGWPYERILRELGEIDYYVNDRVESKPPIVVTDDDITGTFTFLRALPDYDNTPDLTPAQIGQTWLNYIIENRTILWWGGLGNSTEHTAYLRLKNGIEAPRSGSMELNGKTIAEQIGSQIFIDGWAMVNPGDPERAADFAGRAARVSHDGEAVYGAQLLAAMESQAFVESDINRLIDVGLSVIPRDSVISRMIGDIRHWHAGQKNWHLGFERLAGIYNYENYPGNCHMVPNHGLIILALLYGNGDFSESIKVVNTAGWDTDCNSGNVGCLLGIRNGLTGFDGNRDWRGPVADRLFMPAADSGRSVTDAVNEAVSIVNIRHALHGDQPIAPKGNARFHFSFAGSVQGFCGDEATTGVRNVPSPFTEGERALEVSFVGSGAASTPTFILPDELDMKGYEFLASPTLYSGQHVSARVSSSQRGRCAFIASVYGEDDTLEQILSDSVAVGPRSAIELEWTVPSTAGQPIATIGVRFWNEDNDPTAATSSHIDWLSWTGAPNVDLTRPLMSAQPWDKPQVWRRAWVNGMDVWEKWWKDAYKLVQNSGRGLLMQGARDWTDYEAEAEVTPWLFDAGGVAVRVQGLERFYALQLVSGNKVRIIKALDGDTVLAEADFDWAVNEMYTLSLCVSGETLRGAVNGQQVLEVVDAERPLTGGGIAYVLENGHMVSERFSVRPLD